MSDYFLVEARLKVVGVCRSAGRIEGGGNVSKVSEWNMSVKERVFRESFWRQYEVLRGEDVESVEKELEKFRGIVKECINTNDVCGMRHVGRQRRKESEW